MAIAGLYKADIRYWHATWLDQTSKESNFLLWPNKGRTWSLFDEHGNIDIAREYQPHLGNRIEAGLLQT